MKIVGLKTNHLSNPIGFWMDEAVISFKVEETKASFKRFARVLLSKDDSFSAIVFDSGLIEDIEETGFKLPIELEASTRYYWKVFVETSFEEGWSEVAWFETSRTKDVPFKGYFITQSFEKDVNPIFTKKINIDKRIKLNRLYILALGVYEVYLNDKKVGDEILLPGVHDYDSWLQYQTFELPLKQGENNLEVRCGSGWYKGDYGLIKPYPFDKEHVCIAELVIDYFDGSKALIKTDTTWNCKKNPVLYDGIYSGEYYDASFENGELFSVKKAKNNTELSKLLKPRLSAPIKVIEKIKPKLVISKKNEKILDMGQNMVGWLEFNVCLEKDKKVFIQFGEILQDGCFYNENLRTAKAEFSYISSGKKEKVRQHYTFYGFRYAKIEGIDNINIEDFTGLVIHTKMDENMKLVTSDKALNRLIQNVRWGMKGNFLDTATDCPQRDERMGWTGDAQIFSDTACFLMDTYAFYRKFMHDLSMEQLKYGGSVTYTVPAPRYPLHGAAVWGDAATIIPWNLYLHSGDKTILLKQYSSMKAWVDYITKEDEKDGTKNLWMCGNQFGDWLALDGSVSGGVYGATNKFLISSAYYYYSTLILAKTAKVLNNLEDCTFYEILKEKIKTAFIAEFFTKEGRLSVTTETSFAVIIQLGLYPLEFEQRIFSDFRAIMKENNFKLSTGFVGTPWLCSALMKSNNSDLAFRLLFDHAYPGWLYEVDMGATTIWERWNSVLPDGKISGTSMNSLNHYAYGSVLAWVIRVIVGINPTEVAPGFKKVIISPNPCVQLSSIKSSFDTPYGKYSIFWTYKNSKFVLKVSIPFDCEAKIVLPLIRGNAKGITLSNGELIIADDNSVYINAKHGEYTVSYEINQRTQKHYSLELPVSDLMEDKKTRALILKYYPSFKKSIPWAGEQFCLEDILHSPFLMTNENVIKTLKNEIDKLNT